MKPKKVRWFGLVLVAAAVVLLLQGGSWSLPFAIPSTPSTPPLIVMLYEADHGPLPPYALGAANDLNAAGREVRMVDDDLLNGTGEVPAWLRPAVEPGRAIMGSGQLDDALVLVSGERVIKSIKLPASKAEILEAVQ